MYIFIVKYSTFEESGPFSRGFRDMLLLLEALMPFVVARIEPDWLPDGPSAESTNEPKHNFTKAVIGRLDELVATAINEIDETRLKRGEVVIYPERNHPWRKNASTFCFDIMPGNGGKNTPLEQARRRAAIEDTLGLKLCKFFDEHLERYVHVRGYMPHPTFDIELRPISSTGSTYEFEGATYEPSPAGYRAKHRWGQRDFES